MPNLHLRIENLHHLVCWFLPSERVLQDYRNFFKLKPGFLTENIDKWSEVTTPLTGCQRYVVLSFDEMKIQSNLVFDKPSNELIGFVDLGDDDVNAAVFDTPTTLPSHVLAFMVRGVASDLKYVLGYFSTESLTSFQIMSIFWKAVSILEVCLVQLVLIDPVLDNNIYICVRYKIILFPF